jgi:hypothetical protein
MNRTLFLTDAQFKQMTPVSKNVTVSQGISTTLWESQLRYIKPLLCEAFYDELIAEVDTSTLTPENEDLLVNYIRPAQAWYTYYLLIPFAWSKTRDGGQINNTGEFYAAVTREDVKYIQNNTLSYAQDAALRLTKYLHQNENDYPTWKDCNCSEKSDVSPSNFMLI